MGYLIVKKGITEIQADVIINASNGIGYMGGFIGRFIKLKGVAESIHFESKGSIEKEAKIAARKKKYLPLRFCGHKAGEIFITSAGNLKASWIIHAVTMNYPGMKAHMDVIKELIPKILTETRKLKATSIVIPLLGTGTGRLHKDEVLKLYKNYFLDVNDIEIIISVP